MIQLLGLMLSSSLITAILLVPFIDFLYKVKLRRSNQVTKDMFNKKTPLFDKFNSWKVGTPFGGGLLIILVVVIWTSWSYGIFNIKINPWEVFVIFFSFISFGALGFYDDLKKLAAPGQEKFFGLRFRYKFIIQWILAFIIAIVFYTQLHYNFIFIHGAGLFFLGILFVPFAAFVIVSFVNAFNITDGLDGLATGLLIICLLAFLAISSVQLDAPLGIFIAVLVGSAAAFLYFNIYKARLWLGDVGSLSLGAALAVTGLLTGKAFALMIIGGVFVIEVGSSMIQLLSKKYLGRKMLPAAPLHLYLLKRGWEEPKIVMRAWLIGFLLAVLGVFIALI
ncbi:MAG TPA: phospho-N-acetylmuramoyl-pentapeptide-transferase [Candidatus Saccharimonadales bacterium]|nr:phospho-N-acetylmuramoyl-pentapeptide-transferase [Candidatus Saccharimonadales bacterium]